MNSHWSGITDPEKLHSGFVDLVDQLADQSRDGNWDAVLQLLGTHANLSPNQWRIGGTSWFTPLHQTAWLGAPVEVVDELINQGAWCSLRNADGDRAIDIARSRGHSHLLDALHVRDLNEPEREKFQAWDQHLADLIVQRTKSLGPVNFRPVPTEVITLEELESLWFGYPGMYGGFLISIHRDRLFIESWSRVVGGSGQAHVITKGGCVLVEEGFV